MSSLKAEKFREQEAEPEFLDDEGRGLPEGAGVILAILGGLLFWCGVAAGCSVRGLLS